MNISCDFILIKNTKNYYKCDASPDGNVTISNREINSLKPRIPLQNLNYTDVVQLVIENKIVHSFPKGFDKYFENIFRISIINSQLQEIHQNDLKPFEDLDVLRITKNSLTVIEADLFRFNHKLSFIDLSSNNIVAVNSLVFDDLRMLRYLYLNENPIISEVNFEIPKIYASECQVLDNKLSEFDEKLQDFGQNLTNFEEIIERRITVVEDDIRVNDVHLKEIHDDFNNTLNDLRLLMAETFVENFTYESNDSKKLNEIFLNQTIQMNQLELNIAYLSNVIELFHPKLKILSQRASSNAEINAELKSIEEAVQNLQVMLFIVFLMFLIIKFVIILTCCCGRKRKGSGKPKSKSVSENIELPVRKPSTAKHVNKDTNKYLETSASLPQKHRVKPVPITVPSITTPSFENKQNLPIPEAEAIYDISEFDESRTFGSNFNLKSKSEESFPLPPTPMLFPDSNDNQFTYGEEHAYYNQFRDDAFGPIMGSQDLIYDNVNPDEAGEFIKKIDLIFF